MRDQGHNRNGLFFVILLLPTFCSVGCLWKRQRNDLDVRKSIGVENLQGRNPQLYEDYPNLLTKEAIQKAIDAEKEPKAHTIPP